MGDERTEGDAVHENRTDGWIAAVRGLLRVYRAIMFTAGAVGMATLMGVVMAQIVCRFFLGFSLVWSEELARVLLVWITFLFAAVALERGEIIAVDSLVNVLPRGVRVIAILVGGAVSLWVVYLLIRTGIRYAEFNAGQVIPALQFSRFWVYLAVPVGLALFEVQLFLNLIVQVREAWRPDDENPA